MLTYSTYVTALSTLMVTTTADANFVAILPDIIDYAEQRSYRDLDLLATTVRDSSATLTVGTRTFTLPQALGRFVVLDGINIVTPSTTTNPDIGTRNSVLATSREYVDSAWPSTLGATLPAFFAMVTDQIIIVGPAPDAAYTVEVIGTIRPTPLSASNTTTFLSLYLPDLFLAASMIFAAGYQKNFGAQADDPRSAVSWETQYTTLLVSARNEETQKKFEASAWSSDQTPPEAQPPRS